MTLTCGSPLIVSHFDANRNIDFMENDILYTTDVIYTHTALDWKWKGVRYIIFVPVGIPFAVENKTAHDRLRYGVLHRTVILPPCELRCKQIVRPLGTDVSTVYVEVVKTRMMAPDPQPIQLPTWFPRTQEDMTNKIERTICVDCTTVNNSTFVTAHLYVTDMVVAPPSPQTLQALRSKFRLIPEQTSTNHNVLTRQRLTGNLEFDLEEQLVRVGETEFYVHLLETTPTDADVIQDVDFDAEKINFDGERTIVRFKDTCYLVSPCGVNKDIFGMTILYGEDMLHVERGSLSDVLWYKDDGTVAHTVIQSELQASRLLVAYATDITISQGVHIKIDIPSDTPYFVSTPECDFDGIRCYLIEDQPLFRSIGNSNDHFVMIPK